MINLETSEVTPVTEGDEPSWAPDGLSLVLVREVADGNPEIYVFNLETSEAVLVAEGDDPTWSPDGTTIAFTIEGDEESMVSTVQPGSDPVELIDGEGPSWSPEGDQIAFARSE
jgi:Tol biopolymer transport system component